MKKHLWAAVAAFVIWGFFSLPLKPLADYSALTILLFRVVFSTFFLLIYLFNKKHFVKEMKEDWKLLVASERKKQLFYIILNALLLAFNWLAFIYTMNNVSVRATSLAYLICPILTAFLAVWILKERFVFWQWLSLGISVFACVLLVKDQPTDVIAGILVGLSYALFLVFQKIIFIKRGTLLLFIQLVIGMPFIFLYLYFQKEVLIVPSSFKFYSLLVVISFFFTIVPLLLNIYALRGAPSSTVGMLLNINPLIIFLLSIFYWKEPLDWTQVVSYSIIFLAVILFNKHLLRSKMLTGHHF